MLLDRLFFLYSRKDYLHTKASRENTEVAQLGEMVPTSPGLVFPTRRLEKNSPGLVSRTPRTDQNRTVAV